MSWDRGATGSQARDRLRSRRARPAPSPRPSPQPPVLDCLGVPAPPENPERRFPHLRTRPYALQPSGTVPKHPASPWPGLPVLGAPRRRAAHRALRHLAPRSHQSPWRLGAAERQGRPAQQSPIPHLPGLPDPSGLHGTTRPRSNRRRRAHRPLPHRIRSVPPPLERSPQLSQTTLSPRRPADFAPPTR